jgi:type IV secretion system protein VirB9
MLKIARMNTFGIIALSAMAGCVQTPQPNAGTTQLVPAQPVIQPPAVVQAPLEPPPPQQLVRIPTSNAPDLRGLAATYAAREDSTQSPILSGYVNAVMQYSYEPGEIYRVDTAPEYVTSIQLEKGEQLISKAAGDTTRWLLGNTVAGSGADQQVIVLIKPIAPNLHTNVLLTTTKHTYQLDVYSHSGDAYQSGISWNYPDDQLADMQSQAAQIDQSNSQNIGPNLSINDLNFNYEVKMDQGDRPAWYPAQVFDDGSKTYIRFPNDLGTTDAPPLFIVQQGNRADLVNYRVKGDYYIVDRLFDKAELRFGEVPQTIVEIDRTGTLPQQTATNSNNIAPGG